MKRIFMLLLAGLIGQYAWATGEPSTYFQIYVPPNNDAVRRDAALIVTAIYDSTYFQITDDGADGDTDDSKSGMLMAGQSYVLYIRDNGINDDARYASGGTLKWDGDYFIVNSDKLLFASQSTNSDWQHDWVPSTDKKSIGQKFIIYAPPYSSSKRDVNVFAYENNTTVTFQKISTQPKTNTGFTDVNMENPIQLFSRTLNIGEDIIYKYGDGRNAMEAGETYLVLADKPITVQYGALFENERDGGGYVPTSNGSSSGSLMYFAVPFQSGTSGEQEIRMVSWDDNNAVVLERYTNGSWVTVKNYSLNKMQAGDWVGKTNGNVNYSTVFRVTCSNGKRVSVFEGNWFETGSPGTSDMATMVSAENGTSSGLRFLTYIAPPGNEQNVVNPFTGTTFGQQMSHLYVFAKDGASVTIRDAYTNGNKFNKTLTIAAGRYIDCALTLADWKSIYNGTGTASGPERPYLLVESTQPVSVMNANFNDNWMCYVGSSLTQGFTQQSSVSQSTAIPADTVTVTSIIQTGSPVENPTIQVLIQDGLKVVESTLTSTNTQVTGDIDERDNKTIVSFDSLPNLDGQSQYVVQTQVVASLSTNTAAAITKNLNSTVETILSGKVDGQVQQSSSTEVVNVNPNNTSQLMFSRINDNLLNKDSTDSWTVSWIDINQDGYDDLFVTDKRYNASNFIYMNNQNGGFVRGQSLLQDTAMSMTNTWADVDNDGDPDLLVLNNTRKPNTFYRNNNGQLTKDNSPAFTQSISYYHGGSFADYDNDGNVDLFLCNYFPTRFNELYRNNGNGVYLKELANAIPAEANQSVGATWADYDKDGFPDLFVPNGTGYTNSLFHNEGNGRFSKTTGIVSSEGGNSVGSCWGDYDNDGDLDLYVTNANSTGNFLYRNDGNGVFTKITNSVTVTDKGNSHGCSFADIDNDGDLDLYVTNDKLFKFLYLNNGDGTFSRKNDEIINMNYGNSFGHAWSDFDHDGDLDLAAATHSVQPNGYFINNGNSNSWLEVNLTGTRSNRSAIGADIFVYAQGKQCMREVNSQSGFGGLSSYTQHFGLGNAGIIDSILVHWPSGVEQRLYQVPCRQILNLIEPQSVQQIGAVFADDNNNGIRESNEALIGRATVQLNNGPVRLISNNDGYFRVQLNTGTHRFEVVDANGIIPAATGSSQSISINNNQSTADTIWLAAQATCPGVNLGLLMGSTAIRKGYNNNQFTLIVSNNGQQSARNNQVKLVMPSAILPTSVSPAYNDMSQTTMNGKSWKTLTWNLPEMAAFQSQLISFQHGNEASVAIGDSMRFAATITSADLECNTIDNQATQWYKVVGAIDPNDFQVSPAGYGPEGMIPANQELTYTVRFQNIGNHTAEQVTITDVLPDGLDASTVQVIAQSHPELSTQTNGQTLTFHFDHIFLSDSLSNPTASEGYLVFTARPKANILPGTVIRHSVSIRFDQYEALETNAVRNTIESANWVSENTIPELYPNPASDVLYARLKNKLGIPTDRLIQSLELIDVNGRVLFGKTFAAKEDVRLDLPIWLNGFYLVRITDQFNQVYQSKLLVRKPR